MSEHVADHCPRCGGDDLALVAEPDGDATGVWTGWWFDCACGERLKALLVTGAYQPVVEDEEVGA